MVEGKGRLEAVAIVDGTLQIDGWAATRGAGAVDGFQVACAAKRLTQLQIDLGLPSPEVAAGHPGLDQADRCRFRIRARLDAATAARARSSAILCTPLAGGHEAPILTQLIEPIIPLPSKEDADRIGGCFLEDALEFLGYLVQLVGLQPDARVLDVGCGVGRKAFILAHYLGPSARYEGFDIMADLIQWAQREITARVPHFKFKHVDVYNKCYNAAGTIGASEFRFPYEDDSFDLVFLTSVFTHMLADDVRHYLDEIRRVLRPGGQCLATAFLLNEESRAGIGAGRSSQEMVHPVSECFTINPEVPEWAVGYDEDLLLGWIGERGFTVEGKYYGGWCGRGEYTSYQDILVYRKQSGEGSGQQGAFPLRGDGVKRGLAGLLRGLGWGRRAASA